MFLLAAAVVGSSQIQAVHAGAHGSIEDLAIGNRAGSWQLAAFHTAPEFADATPHDKLRLGKDQHHPYQQHPDSLTPSVNACMVLLPPPVQVALQLLSTNARV